MNKEKLYEIAKTIDNDFIGSQETFSCNLVDNKYYELNTNKCDWASIIRVYVNDDKITKITRVCFDTDGYQEITDFIMKRILELTN